MYYWNEMLIALFKWILWEFYRMYFDHIPVPKLLRGPPSLLYLPSLVSSFFKKTLSPIYCAPIVIHRSGWTQEASTLKETPCFSPSSHQVPMAPYLGMGLHVPSSLPARIFSVLNLHKHWVPLCGCPAGCGRCCFLVVFSHLCLLKTFPPPPLQSYLGHRRECGLAVPFSARSPTVSRSCTLTS